MTRPASFDQRVLGEQIYLRRIACRYEKRRQDRDDIVQETVVTALHLWASYVEGKNFRSWLAYHMRTAAAKKYKYAKSAHVNAYHDELPASLAVEPTQERSAVAMSELAALNDNRSETALVRLAMGDTLEDVGRSVGISKERVRQITNTARQQFAKRVSHKVAA